MKKRERRSASRWIPLLAAIESTISLFACNPEREAGRTPPPLTDDPWDGGEVSIIGSTTDEGDEDSLSVADASVDAAIDDIDAADAAVDVAMDGGCASPLAAGDLAIVELMIASVAGTGDYGEWVEVASTEACTRNLRGLRGEVPVGAKVHTFDVLDDLWIGPYGRSSSPTRTAPRRITVYRDRSSSGPERRATSSGTRGAPSRCAPTMR